MSGTIGFIGGGNMASALIAGLLSKGGFAAESVRVSEPLPEQRARLAKQYKVLVSDNNIDVVKASDVVVLAVKPQQMDAVLKQISAECAGKLCISIAAGIPISFLQARLPKSARVIRTMPNTPALVGAGATAIAKGSSATEVDATITAKLFGAVGICVNVDEALIDAVTGLSGSGPAYVFSMIEAMTAAGQRAGLPQEVALQLSSQTVFGAAKLLIDRNEKPDVLRTQVSSPGGTTLAGLKALNDAGFTRAIDAAVKAATERSKELGATADGKKD